MKDELFTLGLTKGEVAVYLALLKLGQATNSPIAKYTELQSSTVYYCLNSLIEKGFVSYVIKNNRKHFMAVDPENIPLLVDEKITQLQNQKVAIKKIVPTLKKYQDKLKQKTTAEVYEGVEGLKTIFREILLHVKKGDSYQALVIEQAFDEPDYIRLLFIQHNKALKKKGVSLRLLANRTMKKVFEKIYGKRFLKTYQRIKYTTETIPIGVTICKDTVITHISEEGKPLSFKIKNKQLADMYVSYFNEVWEKAKS